MARSARSGEVPGGIGPLGFTLIEMIVVLVIIGLALALIMPNLGRGIGRYTLAATAHDVAAALRLARDQAITRNRPIQFFAEADTFGSGEDGQRRHVPRGITLTVFDGMQTHSGKHTDAVQFFPDGSSSGGTINLIAEAARYAVLVDWVNGNVSIQPQPAAAPR